MQAQLLVQARAELGEGPAWAARTQTLYWVDIFQKRIHSYQAGAERSLQLKDMPGCLAPRRDGRLVAAMGRSIEVVDAASEELTRLYSFDDEPAINRFNDGKCDPAGRFLVGTMDKNEKEASGSLYSFDGQTATRLLKDTRISNGLAWSPDYLTFYYIDTPTRQVRAFDYDLGSGQIANSRVAINVPEAHGWPDGMTSDLDGNLWIAMWGAAQVTKWDPKAGQLLARIPVPALHTSSCVFGGANADELYVTSARKGMRGLELAKYPLSGGVFRIQTKVTGMPTFEFKESNS